MLHLYVSPCTLDICFDNDVWFAVNAGKLKGKDEQVKRIIKSVDGWYACMLRQRAS